MHKIAIPSYAIERALARRGRLHPFEDLDPARTALVVVDLQNGFMVPGQPAEIAQAREIVPAVNRLARATRAAGGTVVSIQNTITPESEQSWSVWLGNFADDAWGPRMRQAFTPGDFGHELYPDLNVLPGDLTVRKTRFSAFSTTELHRRLRERRIETLILAGVSTSGVVLSTVRDALDRDYEVCVLADAVADGDPQTHRFLIEQLFPRSANTIYTGDLPRYSDASRAATVHDGAL